jgi:hypothetical protein
MYMWHYVGNKWSVLTLLSIWQGCTACPTYDVAKKGQNMTTKMHKLCIYFLVMNTIDKSAHCLRNNSWSIGFCPDYQLSFKIILIQTIQKSSYLLDLFI